MRFRAEFVHGLPKAELHLHIEGSLEPAHMFELAKRNGVSLPYANVDEVVAAYSFRNLQEFLDVYYLGMSVLQEEADFFELTDRYLKRAHGDSVKHVEIFFDPQGHTARGVAFETVFTGITRALRAGKETYGISYRLIMCFLRHLDEKEAFLCLERAVPFLDQIDGVGLDSSEVGNPPSKFAKVFASARRMGLKRVAHAGEEGPPAYIHEALDILSVDRIDHGNRAIEDAALMERLATEKVPLTMCPISNLKLKVINDLADHQLRYLMKQDLLVTVNSDDPSYFGAYINENFLQLADALDLTNEEIATLARNSFLGSFLSEDEKKAMLQLVDKYCEAFEASKCS